MTLRMILPDQVFGISATIHTFLGRAILPISVSIAPRTLSAISSASMALARACAAC